MVLDQDQDKNISIANIAWSPDGRQVATVDDMTLYLWDTALWTSKPGTLLPGGEITDFAWNVNGHYLAAVDSLGTAYVIDSLTQQIVMTLAGTSSDEYVRKVAWSSDNRLAVTNTDQILVWDTTNGKLLMTVPASSVTDVTWLSDHQLLYGSSDETAPLIATLAK